MLIHRKIDFPDLLLVDDNILRWRRSLITLETRIVFLKIPLELVETKDKFWIKDSFSR